MIEIFENPDLRHRVKVTQSLPFPMPYFHRRRQFRTPTLTFFLSPLEGEEAVLRSRPPQPSALSTRFIASPRFSIPGRRIVG